jgi:hypothetical protein
VRQAIRNSDNGAVEESRALSITPESRGRRFIYEKRKSPIHRCNSGRRNEF